MGQIVQPAVNVGQLFAHSLGVGFPTKIGDVGLGITTFGVNVPREFVPPAQMRGREVVKIFFRADQSARTSSPGT